MGVGRQTARPYADLAKEQAEKLVAIIAAETDGHIHSYDPFASQQCEMPSEVVHDQREAEQLVSITQAQHQGAFFHHLPLDLFDEFDVPWATEPEYRVYDWVDTQARRGMMADLQSLG
ncbi:MAG: hypothetical protein Q9224_003924 [Gallowayella concinna]